MSDSNIMNWLGTWRIREPGARIVGTMVIVTGRRQTSKTGATIRAEESHQAMGWRRTKPAVVAAIKVGVPIVRPWSQI